MCARSATQWPTGLAAANTFIRCLKLLMTFAVDREYVDVNPVVGVKLFTTGEWRAWSQEEVETFRERWPVGMMQRRALSLALFTTQRKADLIAMTQAHRREGRISVTQSKTKRRLWIPEHPTLARELIEDPPAHMTLLTTSRGKAFDATYFGAWFARSIEAAGLPKECVLHGLRKSGCVMLAAAGCTTEEIKSISGHASDAMVAHYTKGAEQVRLADAAMERLRTKADQKSV